MNKQDKQHAEALKQLIAKYDKLYYEEGISEISDAEYDRLYEQYVALEEKYPELAELPDSPTKRVGAGDYAGKTTLLPKYTHKSPLLSINKKAKELSDLKAFYESIGGDGTEVIIQPKLDGITVNINYEDGKFVNAATRGNGYIGDLITENFQNTNTSYPKTLSDDASIEIRGEAIIPYDFFKDNLSKNYSNPRNAVAGIMRSINPEDVKEKGIQVMFYDIGLFKNISVSLFDKENIDFLQTSGFTSVPVLKTNNYQELEEIVSTKMNGMIQEIDGFNVLKVKNTQYTYPSAVCDGLVIKVNDRNLREQIGMTEKGPRWAFAFKFKPLQAKTRIDHVEWQVGASGRITPVAVFDEISLGGVKINKATLNNIDYMKNLTVTLYDYKQPITLIDMIAPGDVLYDSQYMKSQGEDDCQFIIVKAVEEDGFYIDGEYAGEWYPFEEDRYYFVKESKGLQMDDIIIVERSNDVIPRIIGIEKRGSFAYQQDWGTYQILKQRELTFKEPTVCPVCGKPTIQKGPLTYCQNPSCSAQILGRLKQFVSRDAMNITGLGEAILEEFVDRGFIQEPADIYQLEKYEAQIIALDKFGQKKFNNLLNSMNKSKKPTLAAFIYALCIPFVGKKTAKDLSKHFQTLDSFLQCSYENLVSIEGISGTTASTIMEYLENPRHQNMIENLRDNIEVQDEVNTGISQIFTGISFVITGTLSKSRKYYQDLIVERGGKVVGSVSKKTNYVLLGENAGSKETKARDLIAKGAKIQIIDEEEFMKFMNF